MNMRYAFGPWPENSEEETGFLLGVRGGTAQTDHDIYLRNINNTTLCIYFHLQNTCACSSIVLSRGGVVWRYTFLREVSGTTLEASVETSQVT